MEPATATIMTTSAIAVTPTPADASCATDAMTAGVTLPTVMLSNAMKFAAPLKSTDLATPLNGTPTGVQQLYVAGPQFEPLTGSWSVAKMLPVAFNPSYTEMLPGVFAAA